MPEYVLDTSLARDVWQQLDAFTRGYVSAAMWTLTDEDGDSLDYLGLHDIAAETIAKAVADCADFLSDENTRKMLDATGADDFQHGVDFWLTRNRHGAGFWDRGYDEDIESMLTDRAHAYGEADWYVGDDGNVYQM
jgi:hypothetical protein